MNFQDLTDKCRTFHSFLNQKVEEDVLNQALEISLRAPNHKLTFPWHYLKIGPKTKAQIFELALEAKFLGKATEEERSSMLSKLFYPEMVIVAQKLNANVITQQEDYATIACSIQLMALSLASHNYGYKWSTGKFIFSPKMYQLLNLDAAKEKIVGLILVGHPDNPNPNLRQRPDIRDVLTHCE
jgi:nitroreductase